LPVSQLFTSHEKAQRYTVGYAKRLIEEGGIGSLN